MYIRHLLCNNTSKNVLTVLDIGMKIGRNKPNNELLHYSVAPMVLPKYFHNNFVVRQDKQQYEYDSKTDTFRPKHQQSYTNIPQSSRNNFNNNDKKEKSPFVRFVRRWMRNIFLITGGIVWGGMIFATLFVDIRETDFPLLVHDIEAFKNIGYNDVRLLAFFEVGEGKGDLSGIISSAISNEKKDARFIEDLHMLMHDKQNAFMDAILEVGKNAKVAELLGEPVQVCGIRAAKKVGHLLQEFEDIATPGSVGNREDFSSNNEYSDSWTAECLLEGSQGVAAVAIQFERNKENKWKVKKVTMEMMQPYNSYNIDINNDFAKFT